MVIVGCDHLGSWCVVLSNTSSSLFGVSDLSCFFFAWFFHIFVQIVVLSLLFVVGLAAGCHRARLEKGVDQGAMMMDDRRHLGTLGYNLQKKM